MASLILKQILYAWNNTVGVCAENIEGDEGWGELKRKKSKIN